MFPVRTEFLWSRWSGQADTSCVSIFALLHICAVQFYSCGTPLFATSMAWETYCYHGRRNQSLQKQKKKKKKNTAIPSTATCFILKRQHSATAPKETKPVEPSSTEKQKRHKKKKKKLWTYVWQNQRVRNGNGKRVVLSCRAWRFLQSSLPSTPVLTRLLGGKPSVAWRQRQRKDSGEKSAEAAACGSASAQYSYLSLTSKAWPRIERWPPARLPAPGHWSPSLSLRVSKPNSVWAPPTCPGPAGRWRDWAEGNRTQGRETNSWLLNCSFLQQYLHSGVWSLHWSYNGSSNHCTCTEATNWRGILTLGVNDDRRGKGRPAFVAKVRTQVRSTSPWRSRKKYWHHQCILCLMFFLLFHIIFVF